MTCKVEELLKDKRTTCVVCVKVGLLWHGLVQDYVTCEKDAIMTCKVGPLKNKNDTIQSV